MSKKDIPSVLAFERKLDPSDGLFFAGKWQNIQNAKEWTPIIVREKSVRGTISNRLPAKDTETAKLNKKIENANLQQVDVATLPNDCDTLKVCFSLRILGEVGTPTACNHVDYEKKLLKMVNTYKLTHGFNELAKRYAYNLANGRFLWRNRVGAEGINIFIHHHSNQEKSQTWHFNAFDFSLRHFDSNISSNDLHSLAQVIESGLKGDSFVLLTIEAYVYMGEGQEVFPSQELILDKNSSKKGHKSKTLYQINNTAAMHSQKIGNALRTIDTWYEAEEDIGPIAIEPYGSVTSRGQAYRQPDKHMDFYTLFDNWVVKEQAPSAGSQHYVIANLIRGGVFGESGKE